MAPMSGFKACTWLLTISLLATTLISRSFSLPTQSSVQAHGDTNSSNSTSTYISSSPSWALDARVDVWSKSVEAGATLNTLMRNPDGAEVHQAKFTEYSDIEHYGWKRYTKGEGSAPNNDELTSARPVLQALKIPDLKDKTWKVVEWRHPGTLKGTSKQGDEDESPTFRALYNPKHSIIIATKSESPANAPNRPKTLVPLQHWSDITFLTWKHLCQEAGISASNLKYIVRLNVINPEANQILQKIAKMTMKDFSKPFPGDGVLGMELGTSQDARAVVGFPLGRSVSYFLIQHKGVLGHKRFIKDVRFWDSAGGKKSGLPGLDNVPNMLYTLS